jgi:hypothetical protein
VAVALGEGGGFRFAGLVLTRALAGLADSNAPNAKAAESGRPARMRRCTFAAVLNGFFMAAPRREPAPALLTRNVGDLYRAAASPVQASVQRIDEPRLSDNRQEGNLG